VEVVWEALRLALRHLRIRRRMALRLHHVYVCTSVDAPEAKALLDAGLIEGSSNTHPGQGTANRRFFFESGFLELLWVHDPREAQLPLSAATKLWDRWAGRGKTASPFGLCFSSEDGAGSTLPVATWEYRPDYLSEDRCILFADGLPLSEPEVFFLSWRQGQSPPATEPKRHPLGLRDMRSVSVGLRDPSSISRTLREIRDAGLVAIHRSTTPELVIEFTSHDDVRYGIPALGLVLVGRPPTTRVGG
jgi:hypothetical protein